MLSPQNERYSPSIYSSRISNISGPSTVIAVPAHSQQAQEKARKSRREESRREREVEEDFSDALSTFEI